MNTTHKTNFIVMPQDANYLSNLFGGKLLAELDICAAMTARRSLYSSKKAIDAVTVHNCVDFHHGAKVGDLILLEGHIIKFGTKSISVAVEGWAENKVGTRIKICSGEFIFVSVDDKGQTIAHGLTKE
jgi:acyl-CoA hydrolase